MTPAAREAPTARETLTGRVRPDAHETPAGRRVRLRRYALAALLLVLLAGAGLAVARTVAPSTSDTAGQIAAGLRCPACQGESVAQSRSPIAAAMRDVITAQLAAGRSPQQIRDWFVARYGSEVLAVPPARGLGLLLWVVPALALLGGGGLAVRTLRGSRRTRGADHPSPGDREPEVRPSRMPSRRAWDLAALGVVGLVAAVALAGARLTGDSSGTPPTGSSSADPITAQLALARSLEAQGKYATAAQIYADAVRQRPDDDVRLRLAFALIRSGQPEQALDVARQVQHTRPDDPDALLMLGVAQREAHSPQAAQTLRRFLAVAPHHPAADQVRRLLGD